MTWPQTWAFPALDDDGHPRDPQEYLPNNQGSNILASSIVIPGCHELHGFTVANTNVAAQYLLLIDARTLLADGAVPSAVFQLPASTTLPLEWVKPRYMRNGIVLCNSSTAATKTIGAADCFFDVQYR